MLAGDLQRRPLIGPEHRQLDHPPDPGAGGGSDDGLLLRELPAGLPGEQEQPVDPVQGGVDRRGPVQVGGHPIATGRSGTGPVARSWIRASGRAPAVPEAADHLAADGSGGPDHQDRARLLGGGRGELSALSCRSQRDSDLGIVMAPPGVRCRRLVRRLTSRVAAAGRCGH